MIVKFYHLTVSPGAVLPPSARASARATNSYPCPDAQPPAPSRISGPSPRTAPPPGANRCCKPTALHPARALNGATNIALADGEWREEALGFERAYYFFDSSGLDPARALWRTLKENPEVKARYWKQVDGRWIEGP